MKSICKHHADTLTAHCVFRGHVALSEVIAMADSLASDPEYPDGTNVIADFLGVTRLDMDRGSQHQMLARMGALADWRGPARSCAILARGEPVWSLAGTVVALTTLKSPVVFQRFRRPSEALVFVGLEPRVHAVRFGYAPVP